MPEMRKRVAQGNFPVYSDQQCSNAGRSVNQFLPRRLRGAHFVVLSSAACKVGRRIRHRGFLVGWYHLRLEPTDLRRLFSDVRTGRVLGAVHIWGDEPCSSHVQTGNRHFERLLTLVRDLHGF